jgi:hypothetical protein
MAVKRANPVGGGAVGVIDPTPFKEEIAKLVTLVNDADDANRGWLEKQAKLTKLRFGVRKQRSIPWKGASNITVPIIDKTIRRYRPPIASLVLDAEPVAVFTPQEAGDFDTARSVEPFFTWMFREAMRTKRDTVHLVDTLAQRGHTYAREGWEYRTQRTSRVVPTAHIIPEGIENLVIAANQAGTTPLEMLMARIADQYTVNLQTDVGRQSVFQVATTMLQGQDYGRLVGRDLVDDRPAWKSLDSINAITLVDQDPQQSDFFCIVHRMGLQEIKRRAADGFFQAEATASLIKGLQEGRNIKMRPEDTPADDIRETIRRIRDRQANIESDTGKNTKVGDSVIWELFAHIDINQDFVDERVVIWYAPATDTILQMFEYPMPFDRWPITPFEFNVDSERLIDNRGIPEMVLSFQKIASAMYNARIDASSILLAPAFKVRVTAGNYQKSVNWRPGGMIPVTHADDLQPIVHDLRLLSALLQEQQVGQAMGEDYVGTFDATIGRLQDQNAPERRTATEVNAVQNVAASVFGLDAKLFTEALSDSFQKIWNLYEEWGDEEIFFRVQGEEKPRVAKKSEITRNYDIRAAGTPANTAKNIMLQNYQSVLQLALQDGSGILNLPLILQSWLKLIDPVLAAQAIRPPEEIKQVQAIQQAASIASDGQEFGAL